MSEQQLKWEEERFSKLANPTQEEIQKHEAMVNYYKTHTFLGGRWHDNNEPGMRKRV